MASLRRVPKSPYWIACFTLPDGRRTNRSTGSTIRGEAQRVANKFEDASREAAAGRFVEFRARKTITDIFAIANQESLPSSTVAAFFEAWLKRKEIEAGEKTHQKYAKISEEFLKFLGPKANRDLAHLSAKEITEFRDSLMKRVTGNTVNVALKIIRTALAQARRDGLVDVNEAERVSLIRRVSTHERRSFTLEELKKIVAAADEEWKGLILFGLYTGQRLGDLAVLTWKNVDLHRGELKLITEKTSRRQIIPMATPLIEYAKTLAKGKEPSGPLFPRAHGSRQRKVPTGTLSNQFYRVLTAAGLAEKRSNKSTGKGRSAKRQQNELSFHCLRHTATSLLKNAGVSNAVAQEFIGHESVAVSANYTHIDFDSLKKAAESLPDVLK